MTIVTLAIVIPTILYVALSIPSVQSLIRQRCEHELTQLLGVEVSIGDLGIKPFNRATLRRISVVNDNDTLLTAQRLGAGINLYELVAHGKISINYAELLGVDAHITRDSLGAPLNIQPIIDALSKHDDNKPPTRFDLRINTVVIRQSAIAYDILSEPALTDRFDKNHIAISDLRADINIPCLKNDDFNVNLKRLAFVERSGFAVDDFHGQFHLDNYSLSWENVSLALPSGLIALGDNTTTLSGIPSIINTISDDGISLSILPQSHVYLPSLSAFAPQLNDFKRTFSLDLDARFSLEQIEISRLAIADRLGDFKFNTDDIVVNHPLSHDSISVEIPQFTLAVNKNILSDMPSRWVDYAFSRRLPPAIALTGTLSATPHAGNLDSKMKFGDGSATLTATYSRIGNSSLIKTTSNLKTSDIDLGALLENPDLGMLNLEATSDLTLSKSSISGEVSLTANNFGYRRHVYDTAHLDATLDKNDFTADFTLYDDAANIESTIYGEIRDGLKAICGHVELSDVDFYDLNLIDKYEHYKLSATIDTDLSGKLPDRIDGSLIINDIDFRSPSAPSLHINKIELSSDSRELPRQIELKSDFLDGTIEGDYSLATLPADLRDIVAGALPALVSASPEGKDDCGNRFHFNFTLKETETYREFLKLPLSAIYPVTIQGVVDSSRDYGEISIDAPYLRQGNKLIENTAIVATLDGIASNDNLYLTTEFPTKHGPMALVVDATARDNHVDSDIKWKIDRDRQYEGALSIAADFGRDDENLLLTEIGINHSELIFNDSVWVIHPAKIFVSSNKVVIDDINVNRANQFVKINGVASDDPDDLLTVDVLNVNLDYIFESIGIDKVLLGGDATGTIAASSLFTAAPHIVTDGIKVDNISYNKCVLGDALVKSRWDMDTKAVVLDGDIIQPNGGRSKVQGEIYALSDSLDIRLHADRVNVGFMEAYMSAFASDISGIGSGDARLWGTFKDIDMAGDLYVDNLRLKLNFTNTYFTASDSIHIAPGLINLKDITIADPQGHTARLNGVVRHEFFREPSFEFAITDARNMLVYDESSRQNPDWYGRIYANGGAKVIGDPKVVKIDVDVTTAPGSIFTFVLSELEEADDYTFITFRDKGKLIEESAEIDEDINMGIVNRLRSMLANQQEETSADYVIELRVGITPEAEIDLVMDPVAGDKIKSHGSGNLRMVYTSTDNDLRMFGTYTLDRGFYNFTLQDIIIKDFTITEGSSISFTGDPLVARLDIRAIYALNANLSDLDESFLQDKDLNRTNVPVHAVLKVTGDIQQPEISFDLEFPTLNQDTYRKVRSIVSTEEMMNRQIIYLLALNRFYTPDYMASTTKGNELFSVASSTLSSQLSNILGQLSDNWAIAPNLRSDRGDFSDVEVDVALSSRLLNNRLLLNGNFGYRDKSLNTNQFIGDFDLEYLLNRAGTIRLKAYNHYNDQNYYVRTAATTQGVGVMFKRDFDNLFSFLRHLHKKKTAAPADSTAASSPSVNTPIPADSTSVILPDGTSR